jgi:hypothetical protein
MLGLMLATGIVRFPTRASANCDDAALTCLDPVVVRKIREVLKKNGFYSGRMNGRWNKETARALNRFLASKKQAPSGEKLEARIIDALWNLDFDYVAADDEQRLEFLKSIGIKSP